MGVLSSHSPNASSDEGEQISFFANCIREQMYSEYNSLQILNILNIIHSLRPGFDIFEIHSSKNMIRGLQ